MPTDHHRRQGDRQEDRIDALKEQVEQTNPGGMIAWESEALSLDHREQFWRRVLDFESAPSTTDFERLREAGVELPHPDAIGDEHVTSKLWEVIRALARLRVFLTSTDHLSDRDLYSRLWHDVLRTEIQNLPPDPRETYHVDILGSGSDEDTYLDMKYYADEDRRQNWLADFPDYDMPARERPPYDRDRHLPQP
jgi:hypothetical protein